MEGALTMSMALDNSPEQSCIFPFHTRLGGHATSRQTDPEQLILVA
jgi:hypothetical protein